MSILVESIKRIYEDGAGSIPREKIEKMEILTEEEKKYIFGETK